MENKSYYMFIDIVLTIVLAAISCVLEMITEGGITFLAIPVLFIVLRLFHQNKELEQKIEDLNNKISNVDKDEENDK